MMQDIELADGRSSASPNGNNKYEPYVINAPATNNNDNDNQPHQHQHINANNPLQQHRTFQVPLNDVVDHVTPTNGGNSGVGVDVAGSGLALKRRTFHTQPSTLATRRKQAVCVRLARKHYGSAKSPNFVLDGLNMTVPKGAM